MCSPAHLPCLIQLLPPAEIADRAVLFFESLAKTGSGSSTRSASAAAGASAANPVYNLLPDCLSKLLESTKLREEQLQAILAVLLGYVKVRRYCGTSKFACLRTCLESCLLYQSVQQLGAAGGSDSKNTLSGALLVASCTK
jgi:hypothetical protein